MANRENGYAMNNDLKDFCETLKRRSPFDRMDAQHLDWLSGQLVRVEVEKGTVVLTPGVACEALNFIHHGTVQLEAMGNAENDRKVLAELVEGESFPLEALEEDRPVFSTFRTATDTVLFRLTLDSFRELKDRCTVFADFCRYRAASFLEQSRRVYRLHFSHQSEEQQRLSTPLSLLMRPDPLVAHPGDAVRSVVAQMYDQDLDYAIITDDLFHPTGIFTMRDLLRKVVVPGGDLNIPVGEVMTSSPKTLAVSALGYEAALMLAEEAFHHVVLVDGERLAGVVTERELFNLQRVSLSQINAEIASAADLDKLKRMTGDIDLLCENMVIQGVTADQLTQIISTLNDRVIDRTLDLLLADVDLKGVRVAWVALGSEGRLEQTFATDQDNAIIFEAPDGMNEQQVRELLLPVALKVNQALDFVGFPLCKGNIMASNPECCLSLKEWKKRFNNWIATPTPEALLNATIFFDFRHLYGDAELSDQLRSWLADACSGQKRFLHLMTENAMQRTPPIGFFRDFVVENNKEHPNTIDIKLSGVTLFVDAARVFALANGVTRGNTKQRLLIAGDLCKWPQSEVNAWVDAFSFLQSLRIRHQLETRRNGGHSHNRVNPYELNNLDRKFFLESLRQAGAMQKRLSSEFQQRMM
jgi:CBS domain-containing protein